MEQTQQDKYEQFLKELEQAREADKILLKLRDNPKKKR